MNRWTSQGLYVVLGALALLTGCANQGATKPLYMWESFPKQQYASLRHDGAAPEEQIRTLEAQAEKSRTANAALPPGFRAHLGMLYLNLGNQDQARQMWLAEKEAFPESAPYMDQLLMRLNPPVKTAKSETSS